MNGRVAEEMTKERKEARRAPRAANLTGTVTATKEALETKAKGKGKSETRCCYDCGEQGHVGAKCPHRLTTTAQAKKRTKARRENVSLKEQRQKNSRARRHVMTRESGAGPEGTESPDGQSEWTQDQHFTSLLKMTRNEQVSGGLNHVVPQNAGGAQLTWKKVTVVVDSGAAENVMPRRMFPEISTEETERSKMKKGSKDQEERTSRTMGSKSCPSELLKDSFARARGRLLT